MVATGWGKVILLGEHAVVYGHPALAAALDRGVTARCRPADRLRLRVPAWNIDVAAGDDHPVATALAAIAAEVGAPIQGDGAAVAIDADAAIPPAAGLGSSAALAVALARALGAHATGQPLTDDRVAEVADAAERCFHRRPSGVDVALATRGGLGVFRRGAGLAPLVAPPLTIVIGLSGEPRSTAEMVERVATSCGGDGADPRLVELGAAAAAGAEHVAAGALDRLGPLMTAAHRTLATFGISTPALDGLVDAALGAGALGAKLTGAGGGGAVIAIAPGREADVLAAWQRRGVTGFVATLRS
jgi:mevalonate kinase